VEFLWCLIGVGSMALGWLSPDGTIPIPARSDQGAMGTIGRGNPMSKKAAEHHRKAAEHSTHAARHHGEAAKHHEAGHHEKAAHHAHTARGHAIHARGHAEDAAKAHAEEHGKK
jgi:hypothetical protein